MLQLKFSQVFQGFFFVLTFVLAQQVQAQTNHYETIIYDDDEWKFRIASSEPPSNWMEINFDDSTWSSDIGGFGYGDGDDNTFIGPSHGIYLRKQFDLVQLENLTRLILDADYDDGFVAYLNGVEVARSLVNGNPPPYNATTDTDHEAALYQGGIPERFEVADFEDLLVTGENTLAIHVVNINLNSSDMSARFFLSVGVSDESFTYGTIPSWFETPFSFSSSNLPIIVINTNNQEIEDDPRIVAQMGIIANGNEERNYLTDPYNDYDGQIEIEIRGSSSQFFDKKNYRIETQTMEGENNNVSLLGMPEENDWVLHGPFSDKSLMRNVLSFYLGELTGRWAPRTRWCELMINDDYRGVYVLMENIKRDKNRLDIATVKPEDIEGDELTGDYVFRIDRHTEGENDGWWSDGNWQFFYGIEEPHYNDILDVQREYLVNHVTEFEEAMLAWDYRDTYEDYINVNSLVDYFIVNELTKHVDAFKLSFYMQKQKDSKGGKIVFGPIWDFNLGYGNFNFECDPSPNGWIYPCTSVTQWFPRLVEIEEVQNRIFCRWRELRNSNYANDIILRYVDDQAVLLEEAQVRNFQRFDILGNFVWPNSYVGNTYQEEVDFLKTFLLNRFSWMDQTIANFSDVPCDELTNIESIEQINLTVYPNPCTNYIQFDFDEKHFGGLLSIYSVDGRLVSKTILAEASTRIPTQNWSDGSYLYNISKAGEILDYGMFMKQ